MKSFTSIEMRNIRKSFPGITANDDVTFSVVAGEIHGLLGENGAGKSTLMNILFGLTAPDSGQILLNGQPIEFGSPRDALSAGIGMVHQHFMLIPNHTVIENLALAIPGVPWRNPGGHVRMRLEACMNRYNLRVDPDACIWQLSAGEQQRVEILKALLADCRLLVLDEPTSVLTPDETRQLLDILRVFAADGGAVVFITHKLEEVLAVAGRLTVLRRGRVAATVRANETSPVDLARLMIGRDLSFARTPRPHPIPDRFLLEVAGLSVQDDRDRPALRELSFHLREGEILGIAGVAGNGQRELVETLTGMRRPKSGSARFRHFELTQLSAREIADAGVAHIPEDRLHHGVAGGLDLHDNGVLTRYHQAPFSHAAVMDRRAIADYARRIIDDFDVSVPCLTTSTSDTDSTQPPTRNLQTAAKNLSGGNLQKFIVGRELVRHPSLIIASHPTYGVDVGAAETIHQRLLACRDAGSSVLLVSEDLNELFLLSDRIAVMYEGRFAGIVPPERENLELIGRLMTGARKAEVA